MDVQLDKCLGLLLILLCVGWDGILPDPAGEFEHMQGGEREREGALGGGGGGPGGGRKVGEEGAS